MREWEQGSIVLANVKPPRGEPKARPVLIISQPEDQVLDEEIVGVAISTSDFPDDSSRCVELPWAAQGKVQTGLRKRSVAVCDWLVAFKPSDILDVKGFLPTKHLLAVIQKIRELQDDNPAS